MHSFGVSKISTCWETEFLFGSNALLKCQCTYSALHEIHTNFGTSKKRRNSEGEEAIVAEREKGAARIRMPESNGM